MRLTLYQRDHCHLCDLALEVLAAARVPDFESVFIDGDEVLEGRYELRVPVLREETTRAELGWPFDAEAVRVFMERNAGFPAATAPTAGVSREFERR